MAKMERKMTECMGEVQFPGMRSELIFNLLDLSCKDYQQREWVEKWEGKPENAWHSFGWNLEYAVNTMQEMGETRELKEGTPPYDFIGDWLKTKQEAEALYKVGGYLVPMSRECATNQEYLSSPYLPKVRQAAKEAFDIFMANEKGDKEFCERVEKAKQENAGVQAAEPKSHNAEGPIDKSYCDVSGEPNSFLVPEAKRAMDAASDGKVTEGGKEYVSSAQHFSLTEKGKKALERALRLWDVASLVNILTESGWNLDRRVLDKVPEHLRSVNARLDDCAYFVKPRGGLKFANRAYGNAVNYVRILQGNSKAFWKEEQQDYVQIVTGGKMLGREGTVREEKPDGTQPPNPDTCIPIREWLDWVEWDRKY